MRALVEGGADVRAVDEQGLSALLNAVKVGRLASNVYLVATFELTDVVAVEGMTVLVAEVTTVVV